MATVYTGTTMSPAGLSPTAGSGARRPTPPRRTAASTWTRRSARRRRHPGRRTFAMAEDPDWYVGNYEFQVPIFVVTHTPPRSCRAGREPDLHLRDRWDQLRRSRRRRRPPGSGRSRRSAPVWSGSSCGPGSPTSCTSTSRRCCWAPGCGCSTTGPRGSHPREDRRTGGRGVHRAPLPVHLTPYSG